MSTINSPRQRPTFLGEDKSLLDQTKDAGKAVASTLLDAFTKKLSMDSNKAQNAPPPPPALPSDNGGGIMGFVNKYPGKGLGLGLTAGAVFLGLALLGGRRRSTSVSV